MIYYFSSKTKNTENFVKKLPFNSLEIKKGQVATCPFILVVATYANYQGKHPIPPQVIEFIKKNNQFMRGVVAGGNRNFGKLFGLSGHIISRNCNIPLLHKIELRGTEEDIEAVVAKARGIIW